MLARKYYHIRPKTAEPKPPSNLVILLYFSPFENAYLMRLRKDATGSNFEFAWEYPGAIINGPKDLAQEALDYSVFKLGIVPNKLTLVGQHAIHGKKGHQITAHFYQCHSFRGDIKEDDKYIYQYVNDPSTKSPLLPIAQYANEHILHLTN